MAVEPFLKLSHNADLWVLRVYPIRCNDCPPVFQNIPECLSLVMPSASVDDSCLLPRWLTASLTVYLTFLLQTCSPYGETCWFESSIFHKHSLTRIQVFYRPHPYVFFPLETWIFYPGEMDFFFFFYFKAFEFMLPNTNSQEL